jgi:hypothetical protein
MCIASIDRRLLPNTSILSCHIRIDIDVERGARAMKTGMSLNSVALRFPRAVLTLAFLVIGLVSLSVDVAFGQVTSSECGIPGDPAIPPPCTHSWVTTSGVIGLVGEARTTASSATATFPSATNASATTAFNASQVSVTSATASGGPRGESRFLDVFQVSGGPATGTVTFHWSLTGELRQFTPPAVCDPFRDGVEFFLDGVARSLAFTHLPLCTADTRAINRSGSFSVSFTSGIAFLQGLTLHGEAPNGLVNLSARFTAIELPAGATLAAASGTAYPVVQTSPTALLTSLATLVQTLNLSSGISNSLDVKLQNALDALDAAQAGDMISACNRLAAFINEVAAQTGKALTTTQAAQLTLQAQNVRLALGCN